MGNTSISQGERRQFFYAFRSEQRPLMLFTRAFGTGFSNAAQLVRDERTNSALIRRVGKFRLRRDPKNIEKDEFLPLMPRGVSMIQYLHKLAAADRESGKPRFNPWLTKCYEHHLIEDKNQDGDTVYSSVSYWKLYNGGTFKTMELLQGQTHVPVAVVARMMWQVLSTLDFMYRAPSEPIYHQDLHIENIFIHWEKDGILPDFYVGDWDGAGVSTPIKDLTQFDHALKDVINCLKPRWNREHEENFPQADGEPLAKRLEALRLLMEGETSGWSGGSPPDVRHIISAARALEKDCMDPKHSFNELPSAAYDDLINTAKVEALAIAQEEPFSVWGTLKDGLNPRDASEGLDHNDAYPPMVIFGPWQLVNYDSSGELVQSDGPTFKTHNRPNRPIRFHPEHAGSDEEQSFSYHTYDGYLSEAETDEALEKAERADGTVARAEAKVILAMSVVSSSAATTITTTGASPSKPQKGKGKGKQKEEPDSEDGFDNKSLLDEEVEAKWTEQVCAKHSVGREFPLWTPRVLAPSAEGIPPGTNIPTYRLPVTRSQRANNRIPPPPRRSMRGSILAALTADYDDRSAGEGIAGLFPGAHKVILDRTPQKLIDEACAAGKQLEFDDPRMPQTEEETAHFDRQVEKWMQEYKRYKRWDDEDDDDGSITPRGPSNTRGVPSGDRTPPAAPTPNPTNTRTRTPSTPRGRPSSSRSSTPTSAPPPSDKSRPLRPWEVEIPPYPTGPNRDTAAIFGNVGEGLAVGRFSSGREDPDEAIVAAMERLEVDESNLNE
ncbi:hypothetical protein B0T16DRAFT_487113 [Cercophora newfieldiana]|uniref:Protein kinase domain-containing protein n=1 Tax=Cercophora newfieldiana TaxID=92897 RepID=A0AA40D040_9PEZI|nr:hypothetical protein B0T16DRAFT_487113 [Cercophora newfieldiana]